MKTKVMLDLETFGTRPGSIIVALGAVKFDAGQITDRFYQRIDPESCEPFGLRMEASTVLWWLKQSDDARLEIAKPGDPLPIVLTGFAKWLADSEAEVWGNGAAFDNALLAEAYDRAEIDRPWQFWNDRCYRTVKSLYPGIPMPRIGTHHNALNDAESQALHLMSILK